MDNKYADFNSKKFLIMLIAVCVIFLIIVIKAFEYLPDQPKISNRARLEQINTLPADEEDNNASNQEEQNENVVVETKKGLNITLPSYNEAPEFVEIEAPKGESADISADNNNEEKDNKPAELTKEEKIAKAMEAGKKYKSNKQYVAALEEFNSVASLTNDKRIIADSYEEIASIYAVSKRYGTALSFAIKAYNMSPNSSREILLARLYYKTGDIEKATRRINNVLQRDFGEDR